MHTFEGEQILGGLQVTDEDAACTVVGVQNTFDVLWIDDLAAVSVGA